MRHVLVSYSHSDADFSQILAEQLKQSGFSVWKDIDLRAGDTWHVEIEAAIREALAVVVVLSPAGHASAYVSFEWAFALGAGTPVLPLLLKMQPEALHPRLKNLQALDFSNYLLRPWEALTLSLKALADADRPFTVSVPRDAPPFLQNAARALDSTDAAERASAVALLASIADPAAHAVLAEALKHPAPDVRDGAAKALADAQDLRALPVVLEALRCERYDTINTRTLIALGEPAVATLACLVHDATVNLHVRECIAYALGEQRTAAAVDALLHLLSASEPSLRTLAIKSLAGEPSARTAILAATADRETAHSALEALRRYQGEEISAAFIRALQQPDLSLRQVAVQGLVDTPDKAAIPALLNALQDDDSFLRSRAQDALAKLVDAAAVPALLNDIETKRYKWGVAALLAQVGGAPVAERMLALIVSQDARVRAVAASVLGSLRDRSAVPALSLALKDEEQQVRSSAATALGNLKDRGAVPALIDIVRDDGEFDEVRRAAANALSEIDTREANLVYKEWRREQETA